jgi:hypothetical protein
MWVKVIVYSKIYIQDAEISWYLVTLSGLYRCWRAHILDHMMQRAGITSPVLEAAVGGYNTPLRCTN